MTEYPEIFETNLVVWAHFHLVKYFTPKSDIRRVWCW